MTLRIHHTVAKQAAKFGITLTIDGDKVVAQQEGRVAVTGATASEALANALTTYQINTKAAMDKLRKPKAKKARKPRRSDEDEDGEEGDEDDEDDNGEGEGKSIVKRKYRTKYKPHKSTCGDALARQIREEFMIKKDPDTKKLSIDWPKFVRFARANDCWAPEYAHLNHGMARMSIVNRLRAKIRKKHAVVWAV